MTCENIKKSIPDYLAGETEQKQKETLDAHFAACEACRKEVGSLNAIWTNLGMLPEEQPSEALRARFAAMLEAYQHGLEQGKAKTSFRDVLNAWLSRWWPRQPIIQFALSAALLIIGVLIGSQFKNTAKINTDAAQLREDFTRMQQLVALSLLQQQSPIERLKGVTLSYRLQQPNQQIINALLNTLNRDPSVNVRLASLDALLQFSDQAKVREGLMTSLPKQTSPMMQIALIDLLVEIQEKRSLNVLNDFMAMDTLDNLVKERATRGIELLRTGE
ncbi:MAG: zf-HC2 domain-containing protein [bacterium]